jgi:hypothetical protein
MPVVKFRTSSSFWAFRVQTSHTPGWECLTPSKYVAELFRARPSDVDGRNCHNMLQHSIMMTGYQYWPWVLRSKL